MSQQSLASRRFAEADAGAEKLLGYVRMAVAVALALALAAVTLSAESYSNETLSRRLVFAYVGMGCYFFVGLGVVLLVRAGRHAPWIAWATAFADIALISWNLYGAVYFGGIDARYALAFPAAMMLPLALTFGALRFRPGVQLAATALTAVLATIIILSDPRGELDAALAIEQVTLAYNVPPNFIRITMIVSVGLVVALAVWRARRLLERVMEEAEARANLTRFLPAEIAEDMSDRNLSHLRKGRRAEVGVLFIDIRGFTTLTEAMTPEDAGALLTEYRAAILDVAARHGGIVDKFIGDGALLIFGLNQPSESAAKSMLEAASALASAFDDKPFAVGIGAHFGEAMVGAVGDERRLEFTVIGAAVNLASRIEQLTKTTGTVALTSAETIRMACHPAGWGEQGPQTIRGLEEPVMLWALAR